VKKSILIGASIGVLLLIAGAVITLNMPIAVPKPAIPTPAATQDDLASPQGLFQDLNDYRASKGLPPMAYDKRLEIAAQQKCNDMSSKGYFEHTDGTKPFQYFIERQLPAGSWLRLGENLAKGQDTNRGITDLWITSTEGHREAMEYPYDIVGFGICRDTTLPAGAIGSRTMVVESFAQLR
jgi:uncharacterized protein YkwD